MDGKHTCLIIRTNEDLWGGANGDSDGEPDPPADEDADNDEAGGPGIDANIGLIGAGPEK